MAVVVCLQREPAQAHAYQEQIESRAHVIRMPEAGADVAAVMAHRPMVVMVELGTPYTAGLNLLDDLRHHARGSQTTLLALLDGDQEEGVDLALEAGADDVMVTPVQVPELMAKLRVDKYGRRRHEPVKVSGATTGAIFAKRFTIQKPISHGGTSRVYLARSLTGQPPGPVALKVFRPKEGGDERERLLPWILREAATLASMNHPNIIQFYDIGEWAGQYYLVMEYADGQSLEEIHHERGLFTEQDLIWVAGETAEALRYLDEHHLIHRDLKPGNLIVTSAGKLKLIDFGLAKFYGDYTISGNAAQFHGTADYVSPERVRGEPLDVRSDLYSFGVSLYYLATGVLPFKGHTLRETLDLRFTYTPPPVHVLNPQISEPMSHMIARLMCVDRLRRPTLPSLIAMMRDLAMAEGLEQQLSGTAISPAGKLPRRQAAE